MNANAERNICDYKNMHIEHLVECLLEYGHQQGWFGVEDRIYFRNRLVAFLNIQPYVGEGMRVSICHDIEALLEAFVRWAAETGRIESGHPDTADYFDTALIDVLLPRPSQVIDVFNRHYERSKVEAAHWFYEFSKATQYIRTGRVAQNVIWTQETDFGEMVFTINLSKPEKDPKAIAAQAQVASSEYPKCLLCYENVGYAGHLGHPARQSHRVIPLSLSGESWFFQYSPYVYYNEHAIVIQKAHVPMAISEKTFIRLLDFIDFMPHYFIGSNADLPIVGGSMLSHDHYQAGNFEMPMAKARIRSAFAVPTEPGVSFEWLQWPLTTLRLKSSERERLSAMAAAILQVWRSYDDEILGLVAKEHTITPIARYRSGVYELDLVFRSCQVSDMYPDGVYHPHREIHHVKKENIGLIEVMGLAVLPPRLAVVAKAMAEALLHQVPVEVAKETLSSEFLKMYAQLLSEDTKPDQLEVAQKMVYDAIGNVFVSGLEHCGVMALNAQGDAARARFEAKFIQEVTGKCF